MIEKLEFMDMLFGVSMTLLLILLTVYILSLAYHTWKAAKLKKEFYDSSARLVRDLEVEIKLFTHLRQKVDRYNSEMKELLSDTNTKIIFTCRDIKEIKNEFKELRNQISNKDQGGGEKDK
jgi:hypothetical protein